MDPISIVSLTISADEIIHRLGKTLKLLLNLTKKLKYADANLALLIGHVSSLRAALGEIADITKGLSEQGQHNQLVESLNTALDCTSFCMSFLEADIEKRQPCSEGRLSKFERLTVAFKSEGFDKFVNSIGSHVNALNLLLNALQSRSLLEQQGILTSAEAQDILETMKDETSSLFCVADKESIISRETAFSETSRAIDTAFQFDAEILSSRIYASTYRSHLRRAVSFDRHRESNEAEASSQLTDSDREGTIRGRNDADRGGSDDDLTPGDRPIGMSGKANSSTNMNMTTPGAEPQAESKNIPTLPPNQSWHQPEGTSYRKTAEVDTNGPWKRLQGHLARFGRQNNAVDDKALCNPHLELLLLGQPEKGKSTWLRSMRASRVEDLTEIDRRRWLENIFWNVWQAVQSVLAAIEVLEIPLVSAEPEEHVIDIAGHPPGPQGMPPEVHTAIAALLQDPGFQLALWRQNEYQFFDGMDLYVNSIDRLSEPNYLPSAEDIFYARLLSSGAMKPKFSIEEGPGVRALDLQVYDISNLKTTRCQYWDKFSQRTGLVIFNIDLGSYDASVSGEEDINCLQGALAYFEWICHTPLLLRSLLCLCFTKQTKLAAKLKLSPLQDFFPDFTTSETAAPDEVVDAATTYITDRFLTLDSVSKRVVHTMVTADLPTSQDWEVVEALCWDMWDSFGAKCLPQSPRVQLDASMSSKVVGLSLYLANA